MLTLHEEHQYLNLIKSILEKGREKDDRTKTGTLSLFAPIQSRYSLNNFPLLTTKNVPFRLVFEELLWFIKAKTDANILNSKNIHIWDGNNSREYLDSVGLEKNRIGDLGPIYGFQWRHFGVEYIGVEGDLKDGVAIDYKNQGIDQLYQIIHKIKNNPDDRRIILSAWNPADLSKMALPPCHLLAQFYVSHHENSQPRLSCLLYQRSADVGLGVPFNIASYSLLTVLLAHVTGCIPDTFIHTLGDAHVYSNHVDALKVQLEREPYPFPKLLIKKQDKYSNWQERREKASVEEMLKELEEFQYSDVEIVGYKSYGKIAMKMAV